MHEDETIPLRIKLLLAVGIPVVMLTILEIAVRVFVAPPSPVKTVQLEMPTWMARDANVVARVEEGATDPRDVDWWSMFEEGNGFRVRLTPHLTRDISNTFSKIPVDRLRKYHVRANSLGFRGDEVTTPKSPDTTRLVFFGDSSTFGWGVPEDAIFTSGVERRLSKLTSTRQFESVNFGIPGDSSAYGQLIVETFAASIQPDIAVIAFGANDAKLVYTPHSAQVARFRANQTLLAIRNILSTSALFRFLERLAQPSTSTHSDQARPKVPAVKRSQYEKNIRAMVQTVRDAGASVVVVMTVCTPGNYAKSARRAAKASKARFLNAQSLLMKKLPELKSGALYPELVAEMQRDYPEFLRRDDLFYVSSDLCHPNVAGHAIIADRISEIVHEELSAIAKGQAP